MRGHRVDRCWWFGLRTDHIPDLSEANEKGILSLSGQWGREYSAHHSPQVSNKIRPAQNHESMVLHTPHYNNNHTGSVECLSSSVEGTLHEQRHIHQGTTVSAVVAWHRDGCSKHLLNCTVPVTTIGKIRLCGRESGTEPLCIYI